MCVFKCLLKSPAWEKAYSHWLHLFLSWSLCVIKCLFKTLVQEETKSHWLHLSDFSPVCVFKWVLKMPVCGDAYHRRLLQGSYEVRATISRKLCSSISSILYLFITSLPQFDVAHGQALLYVGHHHVLQGKGIDLQNVVLLHLDLTPVWRSTWSGSALCGPPPSPPHEPELQTHSLSLLILSFLSFEKISVGVWNIPFWGVELCSLGGGDVPFWGGGNVSNLGGGDVLRWSDTQPRCLVKSLKLAVWAFSLNFL